MKKILLSLSIIALFSNVAAAQGFGIDAASLVTDTNPFAYYDAQTDADRLIYYQEQFSEIYNGTHRATRMNEEGYCLDKQIYDQTNPDIRGVNIERSGLLYITSSVYLEEAGFYNYSENGLAFHDLLSDDRNIPALTEDDLATIRTETSVLGKPFYKSYQHNGKIESPLFISGAEDGLAWSRTAIIPDTSVNVNNAGGEVQMMQIIHYVRNKPVGVDYTYVSSMKAGGDPVAPNMPGHEKSTVMGCYALEGPGFDGTEYYWLVDTTFRANGEALSFGAAYRNMIKKKIYSPDSNDIKGYTQHSVRIGYEQ